MIDRPNTVEAKTYRLKSAFTDKSIFITCGWVVKDDKKQPFEIFVNSKELTLNKEFVLITRLISAIFRRNGDVRFIIEELSSIHDPEGGRHKGNKFYSSMYSEIAEIIELFFEDIEYLKEEK